MKIIFESEVDKIKFHNWLREVQNYVAEIHCSRDVDDLFSEEEKKEIFIKNINPLWYRIYDIHESMYKVITPNNDCT